MNVRKPPLSERDRYATIHLLSHDLDEVQKKLKETMHLLQVEVYSGSTDEEMQPLKKKEAKYRRREAKLIQKLNDLEVRKMFIGRG